MLNLVEIRQAHASPMPLSDESGLEHQPQSQGSPDRPSVPRTPTSWTTPVSEGAQVPGGEIAATAVDDVPSKQKLVKPCRTIIAVVALPRGLRTEHRRALDHLARTAVSAGWTESSTWLDEAACKRLWAAPLEGQRGSWRSSRRPRLRLRARPLWRLRTARLRGRGGLRLGALKSSVKPSVSVSRPWPRV